MSDRALYSVIQLKGLGGTMGIVRALKFPPVFLALALIAGAQPAYEIRGVVLDRATNQAVQTSVFFADLEREVPTNASGEFRFEPKGPGKFTVAASSDRYLSSVETVVLTESSRTGQVRLLLDRKGEMTGRVVDDESGDPVADAALLAMQVAWEQGVRQPLMAVDVAPSSDGRIQGIGQTRAPWVVAVQPKSWGASGPVRRTEISREEFLATDEDYAPSFWPGGGRTLQDALPAPFMAGSAIDIGTIRVRKMAYRRALVHIPPEHCGTTLLYRGELWRDGTLQYGPVYGIELLCGRDVLLKGLIPGEQYRFDVFPKNHAPAEERTASLSFAVGDRNPELTAILALGSDLQGRIVLPQGSTGKLEGIRLKLNYFGTWHSRDAVTDADGRFRFVNVPPSEVKLTVKDGVLQQVRFNGKEPGRTFEWTGQGELEVQIEDQPAAIAGAVTNDNQPVPDAILVLVRWPIPAGQNAILRALIRTNAGQDGRFQVTGLSSGEYRVLAVPAASKETLEEPGVLDRLLSRAEKVTLTRGGAASVNLRVIDPTR